MKYILLFSALVISSAAFAAKPYGMAGCGLGAQLMGKDGNQVVAATSNWTGTQTFGISSGTSNCVTATHQTAMIRNFIEANYAALVTDMAKGQGESMKTLSNFYGCDANKFGSEMKANYEKITPAQENATVVMANINNVIDTSEVLSASCTNAI